ncbi:YdaU family protein [bacterium]|nr:YdaU family protein [bacterium]
MGKAPAFQFYVGDYLKDTRALSLAAKGAWSDILCFMWDASPRGRLSITWDGYGHMLGVTVREAKKVISEIIDKKVCDAMLNGRKVENSDAVTKCNGEVTLINRRMYREAQELEKTRIRVRRHRGKEAEEEGLKRDCNADVTPVSSSSSSSSSSKTETSTTPNLISQSVASTTRPPVAGSSDGRDELTEAYLKAIRSVRYWTVNEQEERAWFSTRIRANPKYERLDLTSCLERWRNSRHALAEKRRQGKGQNLPPEPRNDLLTWLDRDLERLNEGNGGQRNDQQRAGDDAPSELPRELFV